MNIDTGKLYEDKEEAIKELIEEGCTREEALAKLLPLNKCEYDELKGMNRAQRRRWAREHGEFKKRKYR